MDWYRIKKANLDTWRAEFGPQYDVPQEILDMVSKGVLKDSSWHNDLCPSFMTPDEKLQIWVEHPDENEREMSGPRFGVTRFRDDGNSDDLASTDDLQEALSVLRGGTPKPREPQTTPKNRVEDLMEKLYDVGNKNDPRAKPLLDEYSKLTGKPAPKFMY